MCPLGPENIWQQGGTERVMVGGAKREYMHTRKGRGLPKHSTIKTICIGIYPVNKPP